MAYLSENDMVWSLLSLICGAVVVHWWLPQPDRRIFARWAIVVLLLALIAAVLRWLPGRPGLYLEMLLLLMLYCLVGGWLRPGPFEASAAEKARRAAALKAEEAAPRAAEVKAAEQARQAAEAKAGEEARLAAEAKVAEAVQLAAATDAYPGLKPPGIPSPRNGRADDLKLIKGIGPKNEGICNDLGVYHLDQIADWTADEATWISHRLACPGRIEREHWIDQAKLLAAGGETEHSAAVKTAAIRVDAMADNPLGDDEAAALRASLPAQAAAVEDEARHQGRRPYGLKSPLPNKADDLQRIRGIGPQNERRLHALGIWHFDQIAAWSRENVRWVGSYLAFPGRIDREKWIAQAKDLSARRDGGG